MKNKLFSGIGGKIFLLINCLILAIIFWIVVEYGLGDGLPISMIC